MSKLGEVQYRFEWDAANFAGIYDDKAPLASRVFNRVFRKAIFVRYDVTMRESTPPDGKSFLDIGCGSGVYSNELAKRGAQRVLGLDFSAPMLDIARATSSTMGVAAKTEFVQDEFLKHDFGGEKFDVTIAMGVFDYLEDPQPFLTKMASLTRGKLLASFPRYSLVRGTARRLRYRLTGRGDVFYYSSAEVDRLARASGLASHSLVPIDSSGAGVVLVGDNRSVHS